MDLRESEVAVEYVGETIRPSVADVRETQYGSLDIFFFKASKDCIIDATQKGGVARFINHHCRCGLPPPPPPPQTHPPPPLLFP